MDFVTCRLVISLFHQSLYKRCWLILIWLFIYIGYMYIYWIYIYNFQYLSMALSLIVAKVWNMLNVFDWIVDATNTLEETHSLQWRHNERHGVSNRRRLDCFLNHLFRHRSKKTPKLRVSGLYGGKPPVTGVIMFYCKQPNPVSIHFVIM